MSELERIELLDGLILGDGGIYGKYPRFQMNVSAKSRQWIIRIRNEFKLHNIRCHITPIDKRGLNQLLSERNEFFTEQLARWYPRGIKVVPNDVCISARSIAFWFEGDGSTAIYSGSQRGSPNQVRIVLCTDSFTKNDVEFLGKRLTEVVGISKFNLINRGNGQHRISIDLNNDVFLFIDYIDGFVKYPFRYKIKRPSKLRRSHSDDN